MTQKDFEKQKNECKFINKELDWCRHKNNPEGICKYYYCPLFFNIK